jgi:hypothetical protein
MQTLEIIKNIARLPVAEQKQIANHILFLIRQKQKPLKKAAEILYNDYLTDINLTVFTKLDCENFYETR